MDKLSIDYFIKKAEEEADNQEFIFKICLSGYNCNGLSDCIALKHGKDKGCLKIANEQRQLIKYLKNQLKQQNKLHNIHKEVDAFLNKHPDGQNQILEDFYKLIYRIQKYVEKY